MKTTFFSILIFLLCLANVGYSQSVTLTGFNGKIEFKSFVTNGANIRGTLINFIDQTNQYTAANIAVNDIAWDNQGRRYKVVTVVSTTSTQAVVDLSRVGGGTHFPRGLGFISRETENGLSLFTAANTLGMSTALLSRVLNHNMSRIDSIFKRASLSANIYNSNGVIPTGLFRQINLGSGGDIKIRNNDANSTSTGFDALFFYGSNSAQITSRASLTQLFTSIGGLISKGGGRNTGIVNTGFINNSASNDISTLELAATRYNGRLFSNVFIGNDSILKYQGSGIIIKMDSITTTAQRQHFAGFLRGQRNAGRIQFYSPSKAYTVQTLFNDGSNPLKKFDWFKIDNIDNDTTSDVVSFYNKKYTFKNQKPTTTSGAISEHVWVAGDPAFIQSKNGLATGTTDGSGDLTVTIPAMPDNSYSVLLTVSGTTNYQVSAHTLTTTTFKVRCSNGSAQSVSIFYEVKDY
jgi:hypothetical protein